MHTLIIHARPRQIMFVSPCKDYEVFQCNLREALQLRIMGKLPPPCEVVLPSICCNDLPQDTRADTNEQQGIGTGGRSFANRTK